jgi:hypothetical protein
MPKVVAKFSERYKILLDSEDSYIKKAIPELFRDSFSPIPPVPSGRHCRHVRLLYLDVSCRSYQCLLFIASNPAKSSRADQQLQGRPAGYCHQANSQANTIDLSCETYRRTMPPGHPSFALRFQDFSVPSQRHCPHQQRCCREVFCIVVQICAFDELTRSFPGTPGHKRC